jgi:hypothetical protein
MEYEQEAVALYAVPPSQFTAARDARVAELKGSREAVLAGRLKLLRRPTVAAWCVNLLASDHRDELRALVDLGAQLADAHRRADPVAIRALSTQRRDRVAALVAAAARAADRITGQDLEPTVVADLEATLNAAVADARVAERVLSGRLVRGESFAGFGPVPEPAIGSGHASAFPAPADRRPAGSGAGLRRASAATAERATADREAAAARCQRDAARRGRDVARHARDEAAAVLAEAERRLADAERDLAAADRALRRAEQHQQRIAERLDAIDS